MKYRRKPIEVDAHQWWKNGDHPDDRVGEFERDPIDMSSYVRREGAVVRYFRHPDYPGEQTHDICEQTWINHGWIDNPKEGYIVCPGDMVITGAQGSRWPLKPDVFAELYESVTGPSDG